jgi:hypothetical protein
MLRDNVFELRQRMSLEQMEAFSVINLERWWLIFRAHHDNSSREK